MHRQGKLVLQFEGVTELQGGHVRQRIALGVRVAGRRRQLLLYFSILDGELFVLDAILLHRLAVCGRLYDHRQLIVLSLPFGSQRYHLD